MGQRPVRSPQDEVGGQCRQAEPVTKGRTLDLMLSVGESH